ncbi:MAG: terminus macrodomain insulation protein YfbV [Pseudomonadota bacterium]
MIKFNPQILRDGKHYMDTWPMQRQLYTLFPECRVVSATKFGIQVMPAAAVMTVALQLHYLGSDYLTQALAVGVFFFSLPVQGLVWLGNRSSQPLPPSIKGWYLDIYYKMQAQGCALEKIPQTPRFKELAKLLNTAFKQLDSAFTNQLF